VGLEDDEHAVLRDAVFDQWGIVGGQHERLPLDLNDHRVPEGIKVTIEHSAGSRPTRTQVPERQLERARGRLRERRLLVPDGEATFAAAHPGRERKLLARHDLPRRRRERTGGETVVQHLLRYRRDTPSTSAVGGRRVDRDPFEVKEKGPSGFLINATRSYDYGRTGFLDGVGIGRSSTSTTRKRMRGSTTSSTSGPTRASTCSLVCVGKKASTDFWAGIESARLPERPPGVKEWRTTREGLA